jgi:hypothetical protein
MPGSICVSRIDWMPWMLTKNYFSMWTGAGEKWAWTWKAILRHAFSKRIRIAVGIHMLYTSINPSLAHRMNAANFSEKKEWVPEQDPENRKLEKWKNEKWFSPLRLFTSNPSTIKIDTYLAKLKSTFRIQNRLTLQTFWALELLKNLCGVSAICEQNVISFRVCKPTIRNMFFYG